jgi:hypothetical protein
VAINDDESSINGKEIVDIEVSGNVTYVIDGKTIRGQEVGNTQREWTSYEWQGEESPLLLGVIDPGLIFVITATRLSICLL